MGIFVSTSRNNVRFVSQTSAGDCGHASISMLLRSVGIHIPLLVLSARYPVGRRGMSAKEMLDVLRMCGAKPRALESRDGSLNPLLNVKLPVIAHLRREHFVVVASVNSETVVVLDPAVGAMEVGAQDFVNSWSGVFITAEAAETAASSTQGASPLRKLVVEFFTENGGLWAALLCLILLVTLVTVLVPWLLSRSMLFLDARGATATLPLVGALLTLSATMMTALWLRGRLALVVQLRLDRRLTAAFITRLLQLPPRVFALLPTGDLLARFNALTSVRDFLSSRLTVVALDLCTVVASTVVLYLQSATVAATFLVLTALNSIILAASWRRFADRVGEEVLANASYYGTLAETVDAGLEIKINQREDAFVKRLVGRFDTYQRHMERRAKDSVNFDTLYAFQERLVPIFAVLAPFMFHPKSGLPALVAFFCYFLLTLASPAVRSLQGFCMGLVMVRLNADRFESIQGLMTADEEQHLVDFKKDEAHLRIEVKNVSFSYLGTGEPVIRNVNVVFDESRLNVIVGESGGGKSTLLRIMAGLLIPDEGGVTTSLRNANLEQRQSVAYLNQHPTLFAGSIAENICLFDETPDRARIEFCARTACVHDEIESLALGYQSQMVTGGQTLSAGQCQRIAIARLLYGGAPVLLLDEFTSDIDGDTERQIIRNLRRWPGLKVVVTHRVGWIEPGDHVYCLNRSAADSRGLKESNEAVA